MPPRSAVATAAPLLSATSLGAALGMATKNATRASVTGKTPGGKTRPDWRCSPKGSPIAEAPVSRARISAYSLTAGSGIAEARAGAAQRGVEVRLIADRTTPRGRNAGVDLIVRAGGSVWIDDSVRIAHAKAMVIDGKVTLVGSMNWSREAALNSEDLNLVVSAEVAETYATHWRQRRSASVPFTGRDQWCRRQASGGGA